MTIQKIKRVIVVNSLIRQERMKHHAQMYDFDLARGKDSSNGVTGRNMGNRDSNPTDGYISEIYADCFTSSIKNRMRNNISSVRSRKVFEAFRKEEEA